MHETYRDRAARLNTVVTGPMVVVIGVATAIAAIVLSIVLETAWFLVLFIPALLALGGGGFIIWFSRRSRLEVTPAELVWCGALGAERRLAWERIDRITPAPAGAPPRLAALAQLTDGSVEEIRALWTSPTAPTSVLGGLDHSEQVALMIRGHRAHLASRR